MEELTSLFDRHFMILKADCPEDIRRSQELRYQVYVAERQFEAPEDHQTGLETDPYDAQSVHSLLIHRAANAPAATVRLILGKKLGSGVPFPIEKSCAKDFFDSFNPNTLCRESLGEVSRFAVSKQFRQRFREAESAHGITEAISSTSQELNGRRVLPHLTIGLFKALIWLSWEQEITHWYAVMEPTLLRLLKRFGIHFNQIGREVDYHGKRIPCLAVVEDIVNRVRKENPDIYSFATDDGNIWT